MVSGDLATASEALDSYRDSLVTAEARMAQDRDKMAQLQDALRRLQSQMIAPGEDADFTDVLRVTLILFAALAVLTHVSARVWRPGRRGDPARGRTDCWTIRASRCRRS